MSRHPGTIWLDANWNELRGYNNQWVAVAVINDRVVLESSESLPQLSEIVDKRVEIEKLNLADFAFTFVTFEGIQ